MVQNNLLRVTQVNSIYLDDEILKCFESLILDAAKFLPVSLPYILNLTVLHIICLLITAKSGSELYSRV